MSLLAVYHVVCGHVLDVQSNPTGAITMAAYLSGVSARELAVRAASNADLESISRRERCGTCSPKKAVEGG